MEYFKNRAKNAPRVRPERRKFGSGLKKTLLGLGAAVCFFGFAGAHEGSFSFGGSWVGDTYANMAGGIDRGAGHMGMAGMTLGFDTEKAGWWRGGEWFANGAAIYGKSLTESYLGDIQVASNIDAGTHIYLHELWFRQRFGRVDLTLGLQDLNAHFMASEGGGEFLNSSFGVPPVLSGNLPMPIFPLTGLGVEVHWSIGRRHALHGALFDGRQTPFERGNPHNVRWSFGRRDGVLAMGEYEGRWGCGTYKAGVYYHSGNDETAADRYGFYAIADREVFARGERRAALFAQVAAAPGGRDEHTFYAGAGANYYGAFDRRGRDVLGLAVAYFDVRDRVHAHEAAVELHYKWAFDEHFAIQPDLQYIVDPAGTDRRLGNALAGILRLHVTF